MSEAWILLEWLGWLVLITWWQGGFARRRK